MADAPPTSETNAMLDKAQRSELNAGHSKALRLETAVAWCVLAEEGTNPPYGRLADDRCQAWRRGIRHSELRKAMGLPVIPPPVAQKILRYTGGITLGLGASGLAVMAVGLIVGSATTKSIVDTKQGDERQEALARGDAANRLAIKWGIAGGLVAGAGLAVLIWAAKHKRKYPTYFSWSPGLYRGQPWSLAVRGQF